MMLTVDHWLMRYLRRRGWVVFWLDEPCRTCRQVCWLEEYEAERRRAC